MLSPHPCSHFGARQRPVVTVRVVVQPTHTMLVSHKKPRTLRRARIRAKRTMRGYWPARRGWCWCDCRARASFAGVRASSRRCKRYADHLDTLAEAELGRGRAARRDMGRGGEGREQGRWKRGGSEVALRRRRAAVGVTTATAARKQTKSWRRRLARGSVSQSSNKSSFSWDTLWASGPL
ncbi:hypothetical protein DFH06DRAFT_1169057 [Mycena polygramma]|nr:hypothetical protein DFH06DRAFT_1169057 [Mycena polygramma]